MWDSIRGHSDRVEMFRRAVRRNRLSHAYVFSGPDGVGKRMFARELARCLLCDRHADDDLLSCGACHQCVQAAAGTHPDVLTAGLPEGKAEVPIEVFAGSRERRGREGMCYDLSLRPMSGRRRVAIIDHADHLTTESANTLLKTLEEPPANSLIIMIAAAPDRLLPTIRSRCQVVRFSALADADVAEILVNEQMLDSAADAPAIAALSGGSLTTATQLLNPELRRLRTELHEHLSRGEQMKPLELAGTLIAAVDEAGGDSQTQRRFAQWIVEFTLEFYRETLRSLCGSNQPPTIPQIGPMLSDRNPGSARTQRLLDRTLDTMNHLRERTPIPLCFEGLTHDLARILRSA